MEYIRLLDCTVAYYYLIQLTVFSAGVGPGCWMKLKVNVTHASVYGMHLDILLVTYAKCPQGRGQGDGPLGRIEFTRPDQQVACIHKLMYPTLVPQGTSTIKGFK